MGIPSKQIGQPSATKPALLWNISKQLQQLTGVISKIQVTSGGTWYLVDAYSPAESPGTITMPNHVQQSGSLDPNLAGAACNQENCVQLYINTIDAKGVDQSGTLLQLVNNYAVLVLSQAGNNVVYNVLPGAFTYNSNYGSFQVYYDSAFGTSIQGTLKLDGATAVNFNTTDPITVAVYPAAIQNPNGWQFLSGNYRVFPTDASGYTLYEGGWTNYDDGQASSPIPFAGTFNSNNHADTDFYMSTNGFFYGVTSGQYMYGNGQDLYLTPGQSLQDGDIQNFWYQNTVDGEKWKTSILIYCGHCCGPVPQSTPYSYILNVYKDSMFQYLEACVKTIDYGENPGQAGPNTNTQNSNIYSQVWKSPANGGTWTYLGFGRINDGPLPVTTTTTTTAAPNMSLTVNNVTGLFDIADSSPFTIEWEAWYANTNNHPRAYSFGSYFQGGASHAVSIENGTFYWWVGGSIILSTPIIIEGGWHHFCLQRSGTTVYLFIDGAAVTGTTFTNAIPTSSKPLYIGSEGDDSLSNALFSNFRWNSTEALYSTSGFTPPSAPLSSVFGTKLLLFQGATLNDELIDQSGQGSTINNGTGVYNGSNPFGGYAGSIQFGTV